MFTASSLRGFPYCVVASWLVLRYDTQVLTRNNSLNGSGTAVDRSVSAVINIPNRASMSSLHAMMSLHALQPQHSVRLSRKLSSSFVAGLSTPRDNKQFDFAKKLGSPAAANAAASATSVYVASLVTV